VRCLKCKKGYKKGDWIILILSQQYVPNQFYSRKVLKEKVEDLRIDDAAIPYSFHNKCFDEIITTFILPTDQ
jgi:hypothetical protein